MRGAGGFGQSISGGTVQDNFDCTFNADAVADRNEDGFRPPARPEDRPDHFPLVLERRPGSASLRYRFMLSNQARLGYPDGRDVGQHTKVTRKAKPARVRSTMRVAENEIWGLL